MSMDLNSFMQEQRVSKALKLAAEQTRTNKSKLTTWLTNYNHESHTDQSASTTSRPIVDTQRQPSLFTYLTKPRRRYTPQLDSIQETHDEEIKPTGIDHLFRKFNKYKKIYKVQKPFSGPVSTLSTATTRKKIQFRIGRFFLTVIIISPPALILLRVCLL